jgi:hypothetical protein
MLYLINFKNKNMAIFDNILNSATTLVQAIPVAGRIFLILKYSYYCIYCESYIYSFISSF